MADLLWNHAQRALLPSLLDHARETLPTIQKGNVFRLTEHTVLKRGEPDAIFAEAENTRFVAQQTMTPVPAVYDVWQESPDMAYLVMEFIPGQEVRRAWTTLSPGQQDTVLRALRDYVEQLRAIPQPGHTGWIGPANGGPMSDTVLSLVGFYGPFASEAAFNDWRVLSYDDMAQSDPTGAVAAQLRRLRSEMPDDHRIVFTHGDLNRRNIIVQVEGDAVRIGAILDWTQSGWRPEFWELRKFHIVESGAWANRVIDVVFDQQYDEELRRDFELALIYGAVRDQDLNQQYPSRPAEDPTGVRTT